MFIGKYDGRCEFCGNQTQGTEVTYAHDKKIVHVKNCLVPYNAGVRRGVSTR
jgi:hypothetical protein